MLSIHPTASKKCTPNLLPMRINHNGRIENTEQYWTPTVGEKGAHHAYFRGRHLHGTALPLPTNYTGAVLNVTDRVAPPAPTTSQFPHGPLGSLDEDDDAGDDAMEEVQEEVKIAEQIGHFDSIVVWGHGGMVEEQGDEFVRGITEWVGFAEGMHCDDDDGDEPQGHNKSGTGIGQEREDEKEGKTT